MIWRSLQALLSLVFAAPTRLASQSIVCGTGEGGWDEEDADHLRKAIPKK
ncbi:hypothetical protein KDA_76040 [Dictyobacter alpinus]|uniref:Uncharacterized protein n=1 Tax=Dictyobacter alpinus TaxID=2014873 RepID=A0A402BLD3_9CHLR|nr:hypothetical protein [Dictyobacter alpinus]GCE32120.1 hypothetical protein KDA_76040 [Dictyobacter alpinus]